MNSLWLVLICVLLFVLAYKNYGQYISDKWGVNFRRPTPVNRRYLNLPDSMPNIELLMHNIALLVGIEVVIGPWMASKFGWLTAYIWIIAGTIFIGGICNFGSLFISVREDGKTINEIAEKFFGESASLCFNILSWLLSVVVLSVAMNITVNIFSKSSTLFVIFFLFVIDSFLYGAVIRKQKVKKIIAASVSIVSILALTFLCSYLLPNFQIKSYFYIIVPALIFAYMFIPRCLLADHENTLSFLIIALFTSFLVLAIVFIRPYVKIHSYKLYMTLDDSSFYILPVLFLIAGSSILSGFHSYAYSKSVSRHIASESDEKFVSIISTLLCGFISIVVLLYISFNTDKALGPVEAFTGGFISILGKSSILKNYMSAIAYLVISIIAFNCSSLSVSTGTYFLDDLFSNFKTNKYVYRKYISSFITIAAACAFMLCSYQKLWVVCGIISAVVTAFSLQIVTAWFKKNGKNFYISAIPMLISYAISAFGFIMLFITYFKSGQYILFTVVSAIFVLTLMLIFSSLKKTHTKNEMSVYR